MKKYIFLTSTLLSLTACGTTTVIREIAPSTTESPKQTVVVTVPVEVPVQKPNNKYDDYLDHVLNNSGQANTSWTESKLIEFGDIVCSSLDSGTSISRVVSIMESNSVTNSDTELLVSILVGSVTYLCPEYAYDLKAYIAS